jgi:hypothetical protein
MPINALGRDLFNRVVRMSESGMPVRGASQSRMSFPSSLLSYGGQSLIRAMRLPA